MLLVDPAPRALLLHHDGAPVWPACTAGELARLREVASLFGVAVQEVRGEPGAVAAGREVVAALTDEVAEDASLYAHLTRRRFRRAKKLSARELPAVVVLSLAELTAALLQQLYCERVQRTATGILCATPDRPLREQILVRAAAAELCGPLSGAIEVDFLGYRNIARVEAGGREIYGEAATAAQLRAAFGAGAGIVAISTHSDGIDSYLGPLTLCPMVPATPAGAAGIPPRCQTTGICHRTMLPVGDAVASGRLFSPEEIATRVLILNQCNSVLLAGTPQVDVRWSLTPLLFASTIGSIVATWDVSFVDIENIRSVVNALAAGTPIGRAVAQLNGAKRTREKAYRVCLLGDPRVRLPLAITRTNPAPPVPPAKRDLATAADLARVSAMRWSLTSMAASLGGDKWAPAREAAATAIAKIDAYEKTTWRGLAVEGKADAVGPQLRDALVDFFARKLNTLELWEPLAHTIGEGPPARCPICRVPTLTSVVRFRFPSITPRYVCRCPLHSVVRDVPFGRALTGTLASDTLVLAGKLPRDRWAAKLVLEAKLPSDNVAVAWPAAKSGAMAARLRLPRPWPIGSVYAGVVIAFGTEYMVVGQNAAGG